MKQTVPDLVVDSSTLYPPVSGMGYYPLHLLEMYSAMPDHFPIKILAFKFILNPRRGWQDEYLAGLAARFGGSVELHRRLFPSFVYARLRRRGLRLPLPLDIFPSRRKKIFFYPSFIGEPLLHSRYVPAVHDFEYLLYPGLMQGRDDLFLKRYLPGTLRRASRVVANSNTTKEELQSRYGIPPDKITVVYPAVDHDAFRPDIPEERRMVVRKKYELNGEYFFSLATLEPRKNFSKLIEAYALLPEDIKKRYALVIAGGRGWKDEDIYATLRKLGSDNRIKLLGYIPGEDRAPLMREAELFVLPSLYEGFGVPVLEAMACGTPVVTSARGGLPEVGGDAVVYVDPLRPDSIAGGILSILENPNLRQTLSTAGPIRAQAFQWPKSAQILAGVFRRAAGIEEK